MYAVKINIAGNINSSMVNAFTPVLDYIEGKKRIAALIMVINSNGGDAVSSQLLFEKIDKIRKKKKVYSLIQGIGASGAYWLACASDRIYALDTSIVGSIGIISIVPNIKKLLDALGIDINIYKVGKHKDMLSPFSELDRADEDLYMELIRDVYRKFYDSVKQRRNFSDEEMSTLANGQVFSAIMARKNRIIDEIGNYDRVVSDLNSELKRKVRIKEIRVKKSLLSRLLSS
ncbi:MAG: signal peptide peptidase SppA [Thermoplasmata archaeon]